MFFTKKTPNRAGFTNYFEDFEQFQAPFSARSLKIRPQPKIIRLNHFSRFKRISSSQNNYSQIFRQQKESRFFLFIFGRNFRISLRDFCKNHTESQKGRPVPQEARFWAIKALVVNFPLSTGLGAFSGPKASFCGSQPHFTHICTPDRPHRIMRAGSPRTPTHNARSRPRAKWTEDNTHKRLNEARRAECKNQGHSTKLIKPPNRAE